VSDRLHDLAHLHDDFTPRAKLVVMVVIGLRSANYIKLLARGAGMVRGLIRAGSEKRTSPWKQGWIETDVNLGVHGVETH
jgi:hypothetical protein